MITLKYIIQITNHQNQDLISNFVNQNYSCRPLGLRPVSQKSKMQIYQCTHISTDVLHVRHAFLNHAIHSFTEVYPVYVASPKCEYTLIKQSTNKICWHT